MMDCQQRRVAIESRGNTSFPYIDRGGRPKDSNKARHGRMRTKAQRRNDRIFEAMRRDNMKEGK